MERKSTNKNDIHCECVWFLVLIVIIIVAVFIVHVEGCQIQL